jgi:hypothetical protein
MSPASFLCGNALWAHFTVKEADFAFFRAQISRSGFDNTPIHVKRQHSGLAVLLQQFVDLCHRLNAASQRADDIAFSRETLEAGLSWDSKMVFVDSIVCPGESSG